jgi:hypothetical protein
MLLAATAPAPATMYVRAELPDPPREHQHDVSLRHGDQGLGASAMRDNGVQRQMDEEEIILRPTAHGIHEGLLGPIGAVREIIQLFPRRLISTIPES